MQVVKFKDDEFGIVVIPEKQLVNVKQNAAYSLNLVLTESGHYEALMTDNFEVVGEIDDC